jgi:hypothetical protein
MILPLQAQPILRTRVSTSKETIVEGVEASAKKYVEGMAVCKKGNNILFTGSETICTTDNHAGCTAAKVEAVQSITAQCIQQGGIPSQSTNPCKYGAKC